MALPFALGEAAQPAESLSAVFAQLGLTDQQRAAVEAGRPVAKVLSWGKASEIYVFGAVHIDGSPATYLTLARNIERLSGTPGYLAVGELSETATGADLGSLALDPDDIKALKSCREGDCDVQLPVESMRAFHESVNWSQPDAARQVNELARGMAIEAVRAYRRGGNAALGVYRDKEHPARVADEFATMVGRSDALPRVLPELREYLLKYPGVDLSGGESFFFWEKVDFGMKPTIRLNHGIVHRGGGASGAVSAVAIKQLYASHYFHTALDVSVCIPDAGQAGRGFYLLTLKSSVQDGLTGVKGSILRRVVVDKTRSSLEKGLAALKQVVERESRTRGAE